MNTTRFWPTFARRKLAIRERNKCRSNRKTRTVKKRLPKPPVTGKLVFVHMQR